MTGCGSSFSFEMMSVTTRATRSEPPPALVGEIISMGLTGYDCAATGAAIKHPSESRSCFIALISSFASQIRRYRDLAATFQRARCIPARASSMRCSYAASLVQGVRMLLATVIPSQQKRHERDECAKFETQNLKRFSMNTKDNLGL